MGCPLFCRINLILIFFFSYTAYADEFLVDTPVPTPYEHVFVDMHASTTRTKNGTTTRLPGLEGYIGAYPELQVRTIIPIALLHVPKTGPVVYDYGDIALGLKYRFLQETDWRPQAAFYPKFTLPSGDFSRGTGNNTSTASIPFWLQKNWGSWSVTSGGGYFLNPAKKQYNYLFGGVLVKKKFTESLMLGNELFAQGPFNLNDGSKLIYNFGGSYFFNPSTFVLFSTGHSIAGPSTFIAFLGLGVTWGPKNPQ